jgi:hypothetical protein
VASIASTSAKQDFVREMPKKKPSSEEGFFRRREAFVVCLVIPMIKTQKI